MCVTHGGRAVFQHDAQQCLGQFVRQVTGLKYRSSVCMRISLTPQAT